MTVARCLPAVLQAVVLAALCLMPALPALSNRKNVPAIIVEPSLESRRELSDVVSGALHAPVTLADDALTQSNMLAIEHANPRDSAGHPLNGRELSRPETFELFMHKTRCTLVRSKTGQSWTLRHARCKAIDSAAK